MEQLFRLRINWDRKFLGFIDKSMENIAEW